LESYKNTSVEYAKTLGSLYFDRSPYQEIASKKINYFKEYLFRKYRIKNIEWTPDNAVELSKKSAIYEADAKKLFRTIQDIDSVEKLDLKELKILIKKINEFYKMH